MNSSIQDLIEALRMELQQYGELLARLDQQQETVFRRDAEGVLDGSAAIESQAALIEEARRERELCRADLARSLGAPADASFELLLPLLPDDYRPLIRALVEENNELLTRVRARSRQNHLLLSRTVELMQRLMGSLFSAKGGSTYSGDGALLGSRATARRMYEAVG
ncbi:MAG: flagellar biosynthesis protein FlgN [Pedosphaera sp.]|nr:flagellar biosynthesis protein FlgN [Pedosphaera sp.]